MTVDEFIDFLKEVQGNLNNLGYNSDKYTVHSWDGESNAYEISEGDIQVNPRTNQVTIG